MSRDAWHRARAHEIDPEIARYKIVLHRVRRTDWRPDSCPFPVQCYASCKHGAKRSLQLYALGGEYEQEIFYCAEHYARVTDVLDEIIRRSKAEVFGEEHAAPLLTNC